MLVRVELVIVIVVVVYVVAGFRILAVLFSLFCWGGTRLTSAATYTGTAGSGVPPTDLPSQWGPDVGVGHAGLWLFLRVQID